MSEVSEILIPRGFRFGAARAGLKQSGRTDFALIVADTSASAAAVFTANRVTAAPPQGRQAASGSHRRPRACRRYQRRQCQLRRGPGWPRRRQRRLRRCRRDLPVRARRSLPVFHRHHRRAAARGKTHHCIARRSPRRSAPPAITSSRSPRPSSPPTQWRRPPSPASKSTAAKSASPHWARAPA